MATINANIAALEDKIGKLTSLKAECEAIDVKEKPVVGSGLSIEVVHAVDTEYALIKAAIETLLSNSIAFFSNVKASLVEADEKAANKLN